MNQDTNAATRGENVMKESEADETLNESYPASDPPSWTLGTNHGSKASAAESDDRNTEKADDADSSIKPKINKNI